MSLEREKRKLHTKAIIYLYYYYLTVSQEPNESVKNRGGHWK